MSNLTEMKCQPCEGGIPVLNPVEVDKYLQLTPGWKVNQKYSEISKLFEFKSYYKTIAFVNAIAWIANQEGHHPTLEVGYDKCLVKCSTHAINGLSNNDFICAAKIDKLV